jgi:hypothetical protein
VCPSKCFVVATRALSMLFLKQYRQRGLVSRYPSDQSATRAR